MDYQLFQNDIDAALIFFRPFLPALLLFPVVFFLIKIQFHGLVFHI